MYAQSVRGYLTIGYNLRYLLDVTTDYLIYGDKHVLDTIDSFIQACSASGLHVTSRAAEDLYRPLTLQWGGIREGDGAAIELHLSTAEAAAVKEASYRIQTVMLSEAESVVAYVTRDKRFPVSRLLHDMPSLMSPGVFNALPDVAKYDFKEAGRCLAFEAPTAAAFHLMRGMEDVVKYFYRAVVKQKRGKLMWGPMVSHLRRRRSPPPLILLNNLDNLRAGFRNPTQHPEKIYDVEEAQDLLSLSIDAVNRMMKYLNGTRPQRGDD